MKILILIVALLAPMALAGCTGGDSKESGAATDTASDSGS